MGADIAERAEELWDALDGRGLVNPGTWAAEQAFEVMGAFLGRAICEVVAREREACATAICSWCQAARAEDVVVNRARECGELWVHALHYEDGGIGAVRCEAWRIWGRSRG